MPGIVASAARLRAHVEMIAGTIGERHVWRYPALLSAAEYIESELRATGHEPVRQSFEVSRVPVWNVEAAVPGRDAGQSIVIGAHYDSVAGCPGANDNGTGVAALLELSRRFAARQHARTIRFVAFVNEEPPFFKTSRMGSVVYANAAKARGERIAAMLSLETMGYYSDERGSQKYPAPVGRFYPDVGNFIGFVSNLASAPMLLKARRAFKSRTSFPVRAAAVPGGIPGIGWSDHWSFWQAGYRAMMVTDTAPFRYPWYHTPADTPDRISSHKLALVVDGLEHVVSVLAS